jgi:hypothetical protein
MVVAAPFGEETITTMSKFSAVLAVFGVLSGLALTGCGGGGGNGSISAGTTGRMQVTLQWASGARQVPLNAASVRLNIFRPDGSLQLSRIFVRPDSGVTTTTETFELPQGQFTFKAEAYSSHDATGTPVAQFQTNANVTVGQVEALNVTLGSTVASVAIKPDDIPFTGAPVTINAVAFDAQGNVVLTNQWEWTNSNPNVLNLIPNGATATLTAVGPGSATITVREKESGKTFDRVFNVAPLQ